MRIPFAVLLILAAAHAAAGFTVQYPGGDWAVGEETKVLIQTIADKTASEVRALLPGLDEELVLQAGAEAQQPRSSMSSRRQRHGAEDSAERYQTVHPLRGATRFGGTGVPNGNGPLANERAAVDRPGQWVGGSVNLASRYQHAQ